MSILKDFQRKFAIATPQQKRFWLLTGASILFVGVLWGLSLLKPPPPKKLSEKLDSRIIAPPKRNIDMDGLAATLTNVQRQMNEIQSRQNMADNALKDAQQRLNGQLQDVVAGKIGGDGFAKEVDTMVTRRIEKLKSDGQLGVPVPAGAHGTTLGTPLPPDAGMGPLMPRDASDVTVDSPAQGKRQKLRQIVAGGPVADDAKSTQRSNPSENNSVNLANGINGNAAARSAGNAISRDRVGNADAAGTQTWLPAGSILTGVLITGMDAPASPAAQKQPTPALIRIKFDATLPNHFSVDIKECFALVDGYGQLSSERALLRSQRLTCVRQDGGVIETNLDGYVVGEDGKVGMRGRPVTKEGAMIARTLSAGMLAAVGQRLGGNNNGGLSVGAGSNGGGLSIGALGDSAASGVGASFNKVADFYLELAKEMVPIIEIDAGRQVTIILVHGVSIKNTKS